MKGLGDPAMLPARSMRLLQVCPSFWPGGIQRHVLGLTKWLRERGHYVALGGSPGPWVDAAREPDYLPLPMRAVAGDGGSLPRRLVHAFGAAARLRAFVHRHRIELVHAHESAPALVSRLATLGTRTPVVVTYHGSEPERVWAFGAVARFAARRVITPSHATARELEVTGGVPAHRLMVIGLGIAPPRDVDPAAAAALRRELLGPDGERLVLTVARLAQQKGIDVLIEVARRALASAPRIRFVVVGDGPLRAEVQAWAARAAVASSVRFVGHSERVEEYLAAADMFLLTSRWEALPIAIVEALRAGLPVAATDVGGVREMVDAAVGEVLPPGDADGLARAVVRVCADDALRAGLAANARARGAEARFSPDHVHRVFEHTYAEVIAEAAARP